jgi:choline-sulfatase
MNLLIVMDDEHNKKVLGYNGHPQVRTPHLDRLARAGTVMANAYSSSPICVPARAAFATGQPVHVNRCWDNAIAYSGQPQSWAHRLRDAGHVVTSIGKLHYSGREIDSGFTEEIIPMHIEAGVGDLYGLIRDPLPTRHQSADLARSIGPGESSYIRYDRDIAARTVDWLKKQARVRHRKPWVLFASFMAPHSPLIAPPEFYAMYPPETVQLSPKRPAGMHPWIRAWEDCYRFDRYFESDAQRRIAVASYYGLCSFLDDNVGRILAALEATGLQHSTRVMFLSDHGDNLGARALWGKSTMYEESAAVPMILAGPDIAAGRRVHTAVSHLDAYPSILQAVGAADDAQAMPGASLWQIAAAADRPARTVFSEYHAAGSLSAAYMLRDGRWKYIHYTGFAPELFDLQTDPEELHDRAADPACASVCAMFEQLLRGWCDPQAVDALAKADQAALIERHGGAQRILARGGSSYTPIPGEAPKLLGAQPG